VHSNNNNNNPDIETEEQYKNAVEYDNISVKVESQEDIHNK